MKKILCFGDSNTYGYNPSNGKRYSSDIRWTGLLQKFLSDKYKIIEGGCNNRTAFKINPEGIRQTGIEILPTYLQQNPDIIILSVGANDLQIQYKTEINEFDRGISSLIDLIKQKSNDIQIILCAPTFITQGIYGTFFAELFDETSITNSKLLPDIYKNIAYQKGCCFVNLNEFAQASQQDGLHYDEATHQKIAKVFVQILLNSF